MKRFLGFTLSELLISLGVIALIAAFSVPKIIGDTNRNQTRIQLKEALNTIESLAIQGYAEDEIVEGSPTSMITYIMDNIRNVKRICRNNSRTEGCAGATANLHWSNGATPGILLNNGSLLAFATWMDCSEPTVGLTCSYIGVYDANANSGIPLSFGTNSTHLPLILREGNPRGGLGTLLKKDYVYTINSTWLYQ
jgi:type II secretory pathway pseudopilin PulG